MAVTIPSTSTTAAQQSSATGALPFWPLRKLRTPNASPAAAPHPPALPGPDWINKPKTEEDATEKPTQNQPSSTALIGLTGSLTIRPTADGGIRYEGMVTPGALAKVDPSISIPFGGPPNREEQKIKVSWRLWAGKDRLVRRMWSSRTEPTRRNSREYTSSTTDLRLTNWGDTVRIEPPSPDQVIYAESSAARLQEEPPEPLNSTGR
ncbi:hypothetical protein ACWENQ_35535 [Nonomuraea sp. NPDC004354]